MSIDLVTKYTQNVDEKFATESKTALVTNNDISFTGAKTVKVYKITTGDMHDYGRSYEGYGETGSRYGTPETLEATTEELTLSQDRSFTFVIDKLDEDETARTLTGATALERQVREKVIPEVDTYTFSVMCENAGTTADAAILTASNIYDCILDGTLALDNAEAPENNRVLIVTPAVYQLMKKSTDIVMETETGSDMKLRGVISNIDGMPVLRVPANRLPASFGFMIANRCATVCPLKLQSFKMHTDPPGISGTLVEGRIAYDAFVLDNKADAIYYQPCQATGLSVVSAAGSAAGKTALTVSPEKATGNIYKYTVDDALTPIAIGDSAATWTTWDGSADITAATDKILTLVEATSAGKVVKGGYVKVTAHA